MTQIVGRQWGSKIFFSFWVIILLLSDWLRFSYTTVPAWPTLSSSHWVDQVQQFCPQQDRSDNLAVISPTPTPLKTTGQCNCSLNSCIYTPKHHTTQQHFQNLVLPDCTSAGPPIVRQPSPGSINHMLSCMHTGCGVSRLAEWGSKVFYFLGRIWKLED